MPNEINTTVDLVSPEGELSTVPAENRAEALKQGFTVPTPDQLNHYSESKVYGNRFLLSGGVGAVHGMLPFGVGAKALEIAGIPKEVQKKLQEHNPATSVVGEIAGSLTPYTGLLGIAGKGGKIAAGLGKMVGLGEDAGIAANIAAKAVRGAAEGATFGASKVANDAVLGDPQVVAQHALSEIGTSALWGAGISGGLGIAALGATKGIPAAKSAFSKVSDMLGATPAMQAVKNGAQDAFASASSFVSGIPKEKILESFENLAKHEVPERATQLTESLQELHNTVDTALKSAVKEVDGFSPATNAAVHNYLGAVDSVKGTGDFANQFMYKGKAGLQIDPTKVETFLKNTKSVKGVRGAEALSNYLDSSHKLIQSLGEEAQLGSTEFLPDAEGIRDLVAKNKGILEASKEAELANSLHQHASGLGEAVGIGAVGHMLGIPHPVLAAGTAAYEALRNPIETINRLAQLQKTVTTSVERIGNVANALASSTSRTGILATGAQSIMTPKKYEQITKDIQLHASDFSGTADKLHANTAVMAPHAPSVVSAMQATAGRALQFLSSKIPQSSPTTPLSKPFVPSHAQIASFNRYYQAVEAPLSVLKAAQNGTLTHEGIEALTVVHPALYEHMKQAVMTSLSANKKAKDMPYSKRLMLSLLLGQDLDGSTNPVSMQANQQMASLSGAQAEQKEQAFIGQPKPTQKGLSEISSNEQALTAQQRSAQRA